MDLFGYHLPTVAAATAAFAGVYKAFSKFDADQSNENRRFLRDWLLGLKVDEEKWGVFFEQLFTRLFGPKHFSVKCISRSILLTVAITAGALTIWFAKPGAENLHYLVLDRIAWELFLPPFLICDVCVDYLSLWKTRILLTRFRRLFSNAFAAFAIIIADSAVTVTFYTIMLMISIIITAFAFSDDPARFGLFGYFMITVRCIYSNDFLFVPVGLLLLVALLTSAWLWVYLGVAHVMRILSRLPRWLRPLSKLMDFENHPVRTIGYVAATICACVVVMATLL